MPEKRSVLAVDDSSLIQSNIKIYLKIVGFEVDIASDGLEGLAKAKEKNYDLIFSDFEMPNMNGLQFLEKVKALPAYAHIPVVMLTTVNQEEVIVKAKALGAAHYMIKPFTNESMQAVLKELKLL